MLDWTVGISGDLAEAESLAAACEKADVVVHLAGVLFAPHPERFLPVTNVEYARNLLSAAHQSEVAKFILVSFPHVEGETTPQHPATSRLDIVPKVIHFRTRLEAERLVLSSSAPMKGIVVRCGVVYGQGIKLIDGARWLMRHRMMAIWPVSTIFVTMRPCCCKPSSIVWPSTIGSLGPCACRNGCFVPWALFANRLRACSEQPLP